MTDQSEQVTIRNATGDRVIATACVKGSLLDGLCTWSDGNGSAIFHGLFSKGTQWTESFINWSCVFTWIDKTDPFNASVYLRDWPRYKTERIFPFWLA